jgi:hypothetical protein
VLGARRMLEFQVAEQMYSPRGPPTKGVLTVRLLATPLSILLSIACMEESNCGYLFGQICENLVGKGREKFSVAQNPAEEAVFSVRKCGSALSGETPDDPEVVNRFVEDLSIRCSASGEPAHIEARARCFDADYSVSSSTESFAG